MSLPVASEALVRNIIMVELDELVIDHFHVIQHVTHSS